MSLPTARPPEPVTLLCASTDALLRPGRRRRVGSFASMLTSTGRALRLLVIGADPRVEQHIHGFRQAGVVVHRHAHEALAGAETALCVGHDAAEVVTPAARQVAPGIAVVVDVGALSAVDAGRHRASTPDVALQDRPFDSRFAADVARELNSCAAADGLVTAGPVATGLLRAILGDHRPLAEVPTVTVHRVTNGRGRDVLIVGDFTNEATRAAGTMFLTAAIPLLGPELLGDRRLVLLGPGADERFRRLCLPVPVVAPGDVADPAAYLATAQVALLLDNAGPAGPEDLAASGVAAVAPGPPAEVAVALAEILSGDDAVPGTPERADPRAGQRAGAQLGALLDAAIATRRSVLAAGAVVATAATAGRHLRPGVPAAPVEPACGPGPSKLFCIGLNKTGTSSLHLALGSMGVSSLHWGGEEAYLGVLRACREGRRLLHYVGEDWEAYSDIETLSRRFELADQQYPGSRFVLTVREKADWLQSRRRHVERNQRNKVAGTYHGRYLRVDVETWAIEWDEHLARVGAYFGHRPHDLLVLDVCAGDGYAQLAPFLGLAAPPGPFPQENVDLTQPAEAVTR